MFSNTEQICDNGINEIQWRTKRRKISDGWMNEKREGTYLARGDFGGSSLLISGVGVKSINGVSVGLGKIGDGEFIKAERLSLSLKYGL